MVEEYQLFDLFRGMSTTGKLEVISHVLLVEKLEKGMREQEATKKQYAQQSDDRKPAA
ncbi:MAG: hypothetical protein LBH18_07895 [Spirochaetaceae bacterium]|jgi:hypothetical protein|nr:hypothetical protein [Spirochaetaceae bacterium]